jgi:hypothetical protein
MKPIRLTERMNLVPVKIRLFFGQTELAIATGFFYRFAEREFLITNWHNVTGLCPGSKKPLHSKLGVPNRLVVGVPVSEPAGEGNSRLGWHWPSIALYKDPEEMTGPLWFEHPVFRERVDAVALPVQGLQAAIPANDSTLALANFALRPGLDAFVLGFPMGMSGGGQFPIWKRASIATEPSVDIDGLPKLYIDTATRTGMSGSPVYAQEVGPWRPEDEPGIENTVFSRGRRLLGVYSGRVGDDSFQAQLGIVWKPNAIEEILGEAMKQLSG